MHSEHIQLPVCRVAFLGKRSVSINTVLFVKFEVKRADEFFSEEN